MEEGPKEGQQKLGVSRPQNVGPKEPSTPNASSVERVMIRKQDCVMVTMVLRQFHSVQTDVFQKQNMQQERGGDCRRSHFKSVSNG